MNSASRTDELQLFVRVVDRGGFAAAAVDTSLTPSGVSKSITRLEDRLGVRLLQRTTRRLALTPEGESLLGHARGILASIEAAEAEVTAARGRPRGLLRVNTGTAFAKHRLVGLLPAFHLRYPEITLDLSIADRRVDVIADQVDIAIRTGAITEPSLIVRTLGRTSRVIAASPAYLARAGTPMTAADLDHHTCIAVTGLGRNPDWPMRIGGKVVPVQLKRAHSCDSADVVRDLAIAGFGLCRLARFLIGDALDDGRLVSVLDDIHASETVPIAAVMPPGRQHLPRVRVFLDFLIAAAA